MENTNTNCNQWLSLAKIALKVPHVGRNCSLVARTSRCGECISFIPKIKSMCLISNAKVVFMPPCIKRNEIKKNKKGKKRNKMKIKVFV
jgi:hypothetical protein